MNAVVNKCFAMFLALLLLLTSCSGESRPAVSEDSDEEPPMKKAWTVVQGEPTVELAYEQWRFILDTATGEFTVTDTQTGALWFSNPPGRNAQEGITALGKVQLNSQLLISVYTENSNVESTLSSSNACVSKKGLKVMRSDKGLRCEYTFVNEGITVPVEYTFNRYGLQASVITADIREEGSKVLATVSLLPYFLTVEQNRAGWLLVPDGSGALLELTEGKDNYSSLSYKKYVYGVDPLLSVKQVTSKNEDIRIPAFGVQTGGNGVLGLVTEGAALTTLQVYGEGNRSGYSTIFPSVVYRESDTLTLYADTDQELTVFAYEKTPAALDAWQVQYFFSEQTDYTKMAAQLAEYYRTEKNLTQRERTTAGLYLRTIGGVKTPSKILGIPVDTVTAATSFSVAQRWLEELHSSGIRSVRFMYEGIFKGGLEDSYPANGKLERALGSKAEWQSLLAAQNDGDKIIPTVNLQRIYRSGGGVSRSKSAARGVNGTVVKLYPLQYSTGTPLQTSPPYSLLAPSLLKPVYGTVTSSLHSLQVTAWCDEGLSSPSSDYRHSVSSDKPVRLDRQQTLAQQTASLEETVTRMDFYAEYGNDYMLPYLSGIADLPVKSSRYTGMADIPFLQLVFGRFTEYALAPVNTQPNTQEYLLKMLEYGALPSASVMETDVSALKGSRVQILAGRFSDWKDTLENLYRACQDVYTQLDGVMVSHKKCADGVYRCEYSSGASLYVNYTEAAVSVDGVSVPATAYCVQKGG